MNLSKVTILIGHRGVGKTTLIDGLKKDRPGLKALDLDREIEHGEQQNIEEIFLEKGEAHFRGLEQKYFEKVLGDLQNEEAILAVGAGFDGVIPKQAKCLWVQRSSDEKGRIFLDRPRLTSEASGLEEFLRLFPDREEKYQRQSDFKVLIDEGSKRSLIGLSTFLGLRTAKPGASVTLLPEDFNSVQDLCEIWKLWKSFGFRFIELRTDLLDDNKLQQVLQVLPKEKCLLAMRNRQSSLQDQFHYLDWPLEQPQPAPPNTSIYSLHDREWKGSLQETLDFISRINIGHIKFSPVIESFEELKECHNWRMRDPEKRSFLPRSSEGRWSWYRQWIGEKQKINFLKFARKGSAIDQPSFTEWQLCSEQRESFFAVLGDPVCQSLSPEIHLEYMGETPFLPIPVKSGELKEALVTLAALGLRGAAVTSPLKLEAAHFVGKEKPLNTLLYCENEGWYSTNTDPQGFHVLLRSAQNDGDTAIWGGGGILPTLESILSQPSAYSARTGKLKKGNECLSPQRVIWAAGSRAEKMTFPPKKWQPKTVIDLSYSMDSMGREYAHSCGANYISGKAMLLAQGLEQQSFWSSYECK